jgi:segregation and condensation protein A
VRLLDLDLDVYQGPFDLLFTLILKEEVDVCEVPLVEVILAYVEELTAGFEVDWEGLSEFLVLISSLLEIKSRILVPGVASAGDDASPEEARDLLLARMIRYRQFKGAAAALRDTLDHQRGRLIRSAWRDRQRVLASDEAMAGAFDSGELARSVERLLAARREPDMSHVAVARVDVTRQIEAIRRHLREEGRFSFDEAFGDRDPMVQAVSLFALLELFSQGDVAVSQRRPFGDILVRAREARKIA